MKKRAGFTLLETMISVALFGVIMIILFGAVNNFLKAWLKEYAKQNISSQFVSIYRAVDSDVTLTSYSFFRDYTNPEANGAESEKRWFLFPISSPGITDDGYPVWERLVVYSLRIPKNDKCSSSACCPHKQLIRHEIELDRVPRMSELSNGSFYADLEIYMSIITIILNSSANDKINLLSTPRFVTVRDVRVIASDIVDIKLNSENYTRVVFDITLLRILDAQKSITIGSENLLEPSDTSKRFIEETSWVTLTNNI